MSVAWDAQKAIDFRVDVLYFLWMYQKYNMVCLGLELSQPSCLTSPAGGTEVGGEGRDFVIVF
ncbi:MAG: hypothetical protein HQL96_17075 [Magnetococcales bacterium]|nr:hypothetical protein [Magnetococcales bacterium]